LLNFQQIILRKFIFIFSILFLIVGSIVYYWSKEFYVTQTRDSLLNNIEIISFELEQNPNLDILAAKIKKSLQLRLTVIDAKGSVIAESHQDKSKMDNHKNRDEILQANTEEYGYKIRHSHTIDKNLLYIAKKYTLNNQLIYLRLAKELNSINEQIFSLGVKIFIVLTLFLITIFTIAIKISKQIEKEILNIVNFLSTLSKKNRSTYINSNYSLEFSHITKLLTKVAMILSKREKQKSKYTAKLQVSNRQKDDIISAISHEFKNPIAVINGYSQTLLDDEEINPDIRKKFLSKIYKNGTKLSDLIDTLRLSIKLESGKQSMSFSTINLYDLVLDTVENIQLNYPKREVITEGSKDTLIKADPSLFSVVISNLVENAFKYSEDRVFISFDEHSLNVVDSGIGLSKKNIENITNKFYRVHDNSWNNSLGLGLFIVKNITKLHNFKLNVKSIENKGSTFTINF
jgi:signal transduction histidine kinase